MITIYPVDGDLLNVLYVCDQCGKRAAALVVKPEKFARELKKKGWVHVPTNRTTQDGTPIERNFCCKDCKHKWDTTP